MISRIPHRKIKEVSMSRKLYAISILTSLFVIEGCNNTEGVPTVDLNAPPPSGKRVSGGPGVIRRKSGEDSYKSAPDTPK